LAAEWCVLGDLTDAQRQALLDALRRHVCSVCLDRRDDGSCGLSGDRVCALESRLEQIVGAVNSVGSDRMGDHVRAIREQVCSGCTDQDQTGLCAYRERGECALDGFLPQVIDAIGEVRGPLRSEE
jgi:hypothetical protein